MATSFLAVLRDCPDPARAGVAAFLARAFGLKDTTCASIAASAPITLVGELAAAEAAALFLALSGINRLGGRCEIAPGPGDDLPRIDWPKRPQIFRREISEWVADLQVPVAMADGPAVPLVTLVSVAAGLRPPIGAGTGSGATPAGTGRAAGSEFKGIQLPEITPFAGMPSLAPAPSVRPSATPVTGGFSAPAATAAAGDGPDATIARLNELFPDEESSGFLPHNNDIGSILDRLLPEDGASAGSPPPGSSSSSRRAMALGASGHAVFLAKIVDEGRRQKAIDIIAELARIPREEADTLSKKVIIPVLKGATREEAEAAKQRFAKIGILARIKGPE